MDSVKPVRRGALVVLMLLYVLALQLAYTHISLTFSYLGDSLSAENSAYLPYFYLLCLMPITYMPRAITKPSELMLWLLYFVAVIPSILIPVLIAVVPLQVCFTYSVTVIFGMFLMCVMTRNPFRRMILIDFRRSRYLIAAAGLLLAFVLFISFYVSTARVAHFVGLQQIYVQRAKGIAYLSSLGGLGAYGYSWLGAVVAPLLLIFGLVKKRKLLVMLALLVYLLFYAVLAGKLYLAEPIVIFALYFYAKNKDSISVYPLWLAFLVILVLGVFFTIFDSVVIRRVIIMPGVLSSWYINYSLHHSWFYFSNSLLSVLWGGLDRSIHVPSLVSEFNIGRAADANANFFASSTVQLGVFWGPVLVAVIAGLYLKLFDTVVRCCQSDRAVFGFMLLIPLMVSFINSSIFTILLTGGGLLLLLILYLVACCKVDRVVK